MRLQWLSAGYPHKPRLPTLIVGFRMSGVSDATPRFSSEDARPSVPTGVYLPWLRGRRYVFAVSTGVASESEAPDVSYFSGLIVMVPSGPRWKMHGRPSSYAM